VQLISGFKDPVYIYQFPLTNIYVLLSYLIVLVFYVLLLYWIWFKKGAEILSKYRKAFPAFENATLTKYAYTLILGILFISNLIMRNN
jgi:hypothetical protein